MNDVNALCPFTEDTDDSMYMMNCISERTVQLNGKYWIAILGE